MQRLLIVAMAAIAVTALIFFCVPILWTQLLDYFSTLPNSEVRIAASACVILTAVAIAIAHFRRRHGENS